MSPYARRLSILQLVWILVAAALSATYFHPDEHHQTIELAACKLGMVGSDHLPWEFRRQMRPWMQPAAYATVMAAARAVGIHSAFVLAALCRAATGVAGWLAARSLLRATQPLLHGRSESRAHAFVMTILPCLPYLFVRTSSEALAAACLAAALVPLGSALATEGTPRLALSLAASARVGLFLGLACAVRYQSAFFAIAFLAWVFMRAEKRARTLLPMLAAVAVVSLLGLAIDAWGYGAFTLTPWNYFHANLVEGVAKTYGSEPFIAYVYLLPVNLMAPVAVLLIGALAFFWSKFPRHVFTWVTAAHVVAHSFIAHKEERFMFPLVTVAAAMVVPAFASPASSASRVARAASRAGAWLWAKRSGFLARGLGAYSFLIACAFTLYPLNVHSHLRTLRFLYANATGSYVVHATNVEHLAFYAPPQSTRHHVPALTREAVRDLCALRPRPVFVVTPDTETPAWATPVFTDYPLGSAAVARALVSTATTLRAHVLGAFPVPDYLTVHRAEASICEAR